MTLTRLPGSKWWIETDDVTLEIIGTYNKAAINADIQAIRARQVGVVWQRLQA